MQNIISFYNELIGEESQEQYIIARISACRLKAKSTFDGTPKGHNVLIMKHTELFV